MPELERLRLDHAPALREFELANRAYFAASIPDRGDDYFAHFDARHRERLAEQAAGLLVFHVVVGSGGEVLGRVNLIDLADGSAELGYRIAEHAAGHRPGLRFIRDVREGRRRDGEAQDTGAVGRRPLRLRSGRRPGRRTSRCRCRGGG